MTDINRIFDITPSLSLPDRGKILLSQPFLADLFFYRSVVYLTENKDNRFMGLIINQKTNLTLEKLMPDMEGCQLPVYLGGPVEGDRLFFLHSVGDLIPDTTAVTEHISIGGDWQLMKEMIRENYLNEQNLKIYLGYTGWGKNQLETEIQNRDWVVSEIDDAHIFGSTPYDLWKTIVQNLGGSYSVWLNFPENPILN